MSIMPIEPDTERRCFAPCQLGTFCKCLGLWIEADKDEAPVMSIEDREDIEHQKMSRIAQNRGPFFPGIGDLVIMVVPDGTAVTQEDCPGVELRVTGQTAVRKGGTLMLTQEHWDYLMEHTDLRTIP